MTRRDATRCASGGSAACGTAPGQEPAEQAAARAVREACVRLGGPELCECALCGRGVRNAAESRGWRLPECTGLYELGGHC